MLLVIWYSPLIKNMTHFSLILLEISALFSLCFF